jgi:uncharacterized coiled-coil protein SlyX
LIDLNVGQARIIKVETRKKQLEKHFYQAIDFFNKAVNNIELVMEKRSAKAHLKLEKLRDFIPQLLKQQTSEDLTPFIHQFEQESELVTKSIERLMLGQENEMTDLVNGFNSSNERFINAFTNLDQNVSTEEREMCATFFERMNMQNL